VKQRSRVKLVCVAVCVASGVLCALNRAPEWAAVQVVAAIVVWWVRFGKSLAADDVNALLDRLRDTRHAEEPRPAMIPATVMPNVIAVPSAARRWTRTAMAFRDEMAADRWRQLSTALRHQPRPAMSFTLSIKSNRG